MQVCVPDPGGQVWAGFSAKVRRTALVITLVAAGACGSDVDRNRLAQAEGAPATTSPVQPTGQTAGEALAADLASSPTELATQSAGTEAASSQAAIPPSDFNSSSSAVPARGPQQGTSAPGTATAAPLKPNPSSSKQPASESGAGTAAGPASPGATTPRPGAPAPAAGRAPVKFGSIGTQSGPVGQAIAGSAVGAKAWAADVNARGGLNGHPVQIVFGDDGGDPARALSLAKRMVEQDKVVAFFAVYAPLTLQAWAGYLEQVSVPAIETCSCSTSFTDTSPMVFPAGTGSTEGLAWAHVASAMTLTNKRNLGIIYCREANTCTDSQKLIKSHATAWGLKVVNESQSSIAQPDYTAEVLAARNAGADIVVMIMENASVIRILRSAHRQGYKPAFVSQFNNYDEAFLKNGGADVEGFYLVGRTAPWSTSPKMADFRAAMPKYVPGTLIADHTAMAWVAGKLLEKVAERFPAGTVTTEDVIEGLYGLRGENLGGLIPPTTYLRGQGHKDTNQCAVPLTIKDGKFVAPIGDEFSCAPGWKPVGS